MGGAYQAGWHFVDTPYVDDAGKTIKDFPDFTPDVHSNTEALNSIIGFMRKSAGY